MKFTDVAKNELEKSWTLDETLTILEERVLNFASFGHRLSPSRRVCDTIWHCTCFRERDGAIASNGKGISDKACRASALAELAERISAGSFHNLNTSIPMPSPFYNMPMFQDFLYRKWLPGTIEAHQEDISSRGFESLSIEEVVQSVYHYSDPELDLLKTLPGARLWCDAYDMLQDSTLKIPQHILQTIQGSNGVASGNTIEEAIVQASNEVLERYLMTKVFMEKPRDLPTIDKATIEHPVVRDQIDFMEGQGLRFDIKDISQGLPVNAFCIALTNNPLSARYSAMKKTTIVVRAGVSFVAHIALMRTINELFQGVQASNFYSHVEDSDYEHDEQLGLTQWARYGYVFSDLGYLDQGEVVPYTDRQTDDFHDDIESLKDICHTLGSGYIVLDITHPELKIPAVSVFMPRLKYSLANLKEFEDILTMWRKDREYEEQFRRFWKSYDRSGPLLPLSKGFR